MDTLINEDFVFSPYIKLTAQISKCSLEKYLDGIEHAIKLEGDLPIFLDTNILLGYYGMSQNEKNKLIHFIQGYKDRIYLTRQIEQEYLNNRISVIRKDFFDPLSKVVSDFSSLQNEIEKKFQKYKEEKKKILSNDYPDLWTKFEEIESDVLKKIKNQTFKSEIDEKVKSSTQINKGIILKDEMLDQISTLKFTDALTEAELLFLKSEFDKLLITYKEARETSRWKLSFPGCAEKKENPYGDFIIYHEMLAFMKKNNTSCIFLTNDVTKGDWLQNDKSPHIHYLENSFLRTNNIIFIVDGEQTLPAISFENIHQGPLEILSAKYGPPQSDKQLDVTSILRELIVDNKLTIKSSNEIAGDPHYGVMKDLIINYRVGERDFDVSIPEGTTETIPQYFYK